MNRNFSLFQSHLDLAKAYWARLLDKSSIVIDATCGNGLDAAFLASREVQHLYCIDIQKEAIESTQSRLKEFSCQVSFFQQCHSRFPEEIAEKSVTLIVYNLGYLPGGQKSVTTKTGSTLESLYQALKLLKPGGVVSVTCYPGHEEGAVEEKRLLDWCSGLDPAHWCCCYHDFANRRKSPSLILIQKTL